MPKIWSVFQISPRNRDNPKIGQQQTNLRERLGVRNTSATPDRARNKERIMKESGRSLSGALKRARAALWTYGDPKKRRKAVEALDDIDHRLASSIDVTAKAVARIEKLFANSIWCATTDQAILASVEPCSGEESALPQSSELRPHAGIHRPHGCPHVRSEQGDRGRTGPAGAQTRTPGPPEACRRPKRQRPRLLARSCQAPAAS